MPSAVKCSDVDGKRNDDGPSVGTDGGALPESALIPTASPTSGPIDGPTISATGYSVRLRMSNSLLAVAVNTSRARTFGPMLLTCTV